ncbi:type II toxin-antitoxin system VapB family antitoxin [Dietzia sp.]|uniref:type II toxin-antitoxin system VapB family antitoxin n=1 Tax=Dietzia sp. TaxID=1871616 RepID=UPI002FDAD11D
MATLNIKDPRVHVLATELARQRGTTATAVVRDALEKEAARQPKPIDRDRLRALQGKMQEMDLVGLSNDDIYDEDGLPK